MPIQLKSNSSTLPTHGAMGPHRFASYPLALLHALELDHAATGEELVECSLYKRGVAPHWPLDSPLACAKPHC